ncbi:MAG: transposase [Bacilli bacterium]|nr:transposase [Bacilli bacterium]
MKRLERGRFQWPVEQDEPIQIDLEELKWLLDGYSIR